MKSKKRFLRLLVLSMIVVVSFVACKKEEKAVVTEEAATTESAEVVKTEIVDSVVIADAPEGCPKQNTLVVWSEGIDEVAIDSAHSWFLEWSPDFGSLKFFTYDGFDPKQYGAHSVVGSEVSSGFDLRNTNTTELKAGVYTNNQEDLNSTTFNQVTNFGVSTEESSRWVSPKDADVEITYKGTDYVCGKLDVTDGYGSFKGEFIAKYYKWGSN